MADKNKKIDYTSRDFDSIRSSLIEYAKTYYPDTFQDFNEASFGMQMLENVAYVGDVLSLYLDYEANEGFLETASEYENVLKIARERGYSYNPAKSAVGPLSLYVLIPALSDGIGPDEDYIPVLKSGSEFSTTDGNTFTLVEDVDFSVNSDIRVAQTDNNTGEPVTYVIKKVGQVVSGNRERQTFDIGSFQRFRELIIRDPGITEVISVTDTEGNEYYEVDSLTQNVVYQKVMNRGTDRDSAKSRLEPVVVPRRFVFERNEESGLLRFGYGSEDDNSFLDNPDRKILKTSGREYISDTTFDPNNLIENDKFGISPANTTIEVVYRRNTSENVNAAVNTVNNPTNPIMFFENRQNLNNQDVSFVRGSLEVTNEEPIHGDSGLPDAGELKERVRGYYSTQDRAVTLQDYEALVYAIPSQFTSVKRAMAVSSKSEVDRAVKIYIVSQDEEGNLVNSTEVQKDNIKTWLEQKKMLTDTVVVEDAYIINLGIDFTLVSERQENKNNILSKAERVLRNNFLNKRQISEDLEITKIYNILNEVEGVADVTDVNISRKLGPNYSDVRYSIEKNITPDDRFLHCPDNCIFDIKYPSEDIKGGIK